MRNAKKTEFILNLEKEDKYDFMTVGEAIPELTLIAREHNLNLTNPSDYKEAVRILRSPRG